MEDVEPISLDLVRQDQLQSAMRLLHTLTVVCLSCFSLNAGASENPLAGALRDPWGIIGEAKNRTQMKPFSTDPSVLGGSPGSSSLNTPTEASNFGPTFQAFQSQYTSHLDFPILGKTREDSFVTRYDRGAREWDTFQPTQAMFPPGTVFYGDPGALVATVNPLDTTIATTRWSFFPIYVLAFASLLLLSIYFQVRFQAKSTPHHTAVSPSANGRSGRVNLNEGMEK